MAVAVKKIAGATRASVKKTSGKTIIGGNELATMPLSSDANLRAYYKLENVNDSTANGYNLTNNNTVTFSSAKFNNGANFSASNSNKSLTISSDLGITGGASTFSFWIKLSAEIGSGDWDFIGQNDAGTVVSFLVRYSYNSGSRILYFWRVKQNVAIQGPSYSVTLGTSNWNHIVMTYDATNIRGYMNGSLVAGPTAASGNGSGSISDSAIIGSLTSGIIDDVSIFKRALTATEIYNIYNTQIKKISGVSNT